MINNTLDLGLWSLLPLTIALLVAFKTRSAIFALMLGSGAGALLLSVISVAHSINPFANMSQLFQKALGNADFIWICLIICLIGVMFELFKFNGVIEAFTKKMSPKASNQKSVGLTTWFMGLMIVDDYFSPLMSGAIMRPLSDRVKIPREKLAFILDSTTSSVCILMPFMAWGTMMTGLIKAQGGAIENIEQAFTVFLHSIPYNFYAILLLVFTLGIVLKVIPDFGPMKKAEQRSKQTGQLLREGSLPLSVDDETASPSNIHPHLLVDFAMPVAVLFACIITSVFWYKSVMIVESFMAALMLQIITMSIKKRFSSIEQLTQVIIKGIIGVIPTLLIIALAYVLNTVTKDLGAANYIVNHIQTYLTPTTLVAFTFVLTAVFSFATGTSWGAYALVTPLSLPLVYAFNGGIIDDLLLYTVAAIAGGGVFGDHASPVSDTTILSSAGAGSDHMDHVVTQLPYAALVAGVTFLLYLWL